MTNFNLVGKAFILKKICIYEAKANIEKNKEKEKEKFVTVVILGRPGEVSLLTLHISGLFFNVFFSSLWS